MALQSSGKISISDLANELGISTTGLSLGSATARNLAGVPSGKISLGASFYGKANIIAIAITSTVTNVNLFALAGSPSAPNKYKFTINAGVIVGSSNPALPALDVGQFPAGTTIEIDNYGSIEGAGGYGGGYYSAGGAGGDGIKANYPNQTVTINNYSGALIYAGGGGGGSGGAGGTGGTGGQGYYTYAQTYGGGVASSSSCNAACSSNYGGAYACYSGCSSGQSCSDTYDSKSGTWSSGTPVYNSKTGTMSCSNGGTLSTTYTCGTCYYTATAYTGGGSGGGGGAGGAGGRGYGYGNTNVYAYGGEAGAGGSAGGTNAGYGGTGGTGGPGGAGGGWGTAGAQGGTGNTGGTGASGNYTGGSAGYGGAAGAGGGAPGRYLVKGSASVTLNNSGSLAGSLA